VSEPVLLKFMNKKAFTLVEVMVSLSIFSLLFLFALSMEMTNIKIKKYNEDTRINLNFYEALKNNLMNNSSYNSLKAYSGKTVYLEKEKMNLSFLKDNYYKISDFFSALKPEVKPYIEIQVIDSSPVLKLILKMYLTLNGNEENIDYEFYRGDY
jgi:prepilin-type N-terminal cleavage/methylation domain-containing protein